MKINDILNNINNYVWGWGLIFLLIFTGIVYTFKLGFIQFRLPFFLAGAFKSKRSSNKNGGISQLKTVTSSLGTAMGTGNIIGVAAAIAIGGKGAVFWMWVSAFFGMALVYAENCLSILYRHKEGGRWLGGPAAYLSRGVGSKFLAVMFSMFCIAASFGMGGMVQANSIGIETERYFSGSKALTALCIFAAVFLVISGGIGRIGSAAQVIIPLLTGIYIIISAAVIVYFRDEIPNAFREIFKSAFDFKAVGGGAGATALSVGIRRGIFSNEAGLGSSPIMHGAADGEEPSEQGMWSIFEVFLDTIVCCTLTALVLILSGADDISTAFSVILGEKSSIFVSVSVILFAFCTITGWYYCGETSFRYLSGNRHTKLFGFLFSLIVSLGAVFSPESVWSLSDIFNGLMAFPNILALLLLFPKVRAEKTYKIINE